MKTRNFSKVPKIQILALLAFSLITALAAESRASSEPLDVFTCTRALFSSDLLNSNRHEKSAPRSYLMAGLPFGKTPQAFVVNLGRVWQRHGEKAGTAPGFTVITPKGMSCHQLHHPEYDHGAGNLWENYSYVLDYPELKKVSFQITVHRENESRKFLGSSVRERELPPRNLKPRSCLNPDNLEFKRLLHQLSRMAELQKNALKSEARSRRDIREHSGDGPGPAFNPSATLNLSPKAVKACRKIANQELNQALDQYEHTAAEFERSSESRHSSRRHSLR